MNHQLGNLACLLREADALGRSGPAEGAEPLRPLRKCSAPKPVRRFAAAARRRRLRPSHADRPWNNHRRSLRSRRRMFHERGCATVLFELWTPKTAEGSRALQT